MVIKQLVRTFAVLMIGRLIQSTPEKTDCEWVKPGEVTRIRDLSDCSKFYYCINGKAPYRAACPTNDEIFLYFEPNSTHCDHYWKAPKDCFGTGTGEGSGTYVTTTYTTTTTTTQAPTTTTKPPRPPILEDEPDFKIDCSRKVCGMFPSTYGACGTYVVCVNGEKLTKKCNGGQLFDVKTKECQPANKATCWKEPNAGPHIRSKGQAECPFHGNKATKPTETRKDGVILQNPVVTNWGTWQKWEECPKGTYATGIYAWRRLLMQGWKNDHAGIVSMSFICQSPGGNETKNIIESLAPHLPHDGWPFHYMCKGAVVGIRLNSVANNGWGTDNLATDNIKGMCSCSAPVYKPYEEAKYAPQNGNRGVWTTPQYCKKGQAICGMQTQMHDYKEYLVGTYDNTGMNNIKVKCCNVPDPLDKCDPKEERLHIRNCDNSKSDEGLRCDFEAEIGLSMDYDANQKLVDFFSSIGYTFKDAKKIISTRIESKLSDKIQNGDKLLYTWDDMAPSVKEDMKVVSKTMYIKPFEKLELYQIVGRCGYFLMRTNRYLRIAKYGKTGRVKQNMYFEI